MVDGSPAELTSALGTDYRRLFVPDARLEAFRRSTSVDLTKTSRALAANYDFGTLILITGDGLTGDPLEAFAERAVGGARLETPAAGMTMATAVVGTTPQTVLVVEGHMMAVALSDPTLAKIVALYAQRKLARAPTIFNSAALRSLPGPAPGQLHFYAVGPFLRPGADGGLLAACTAIGVHAHVHAHRIELRMDLSGSWTPTDKQAALAVWDSVVASELGGALKLDQAPAPQLSVTGEHVSASLVLDLDDTLVGLHSLVAASIQQLMAASPSATTTLSGNQTLTTRSTVRETSANFAGQEHH